MDQAAIPHQACHRGHSEGLSLIPGFLALSHTQHTTTEIQRTQNQHMLLGYLCVKKIHVKNTQESSVVRNLNLAKWGGF